MNFDGKSIHTLFGFNIIAFHNFSDDLGVLKIIIWRVPACLSFLLFIELYTI